MVKKRVPALVYSRVVGYYSNVRNFNKGKRQEFKDRKVYAKPKEVAGAEAQAPEAQA